MNTKSIKFRILIWYSLTLFLATAFVFSSFYLVTKQILFQQVDQELTTHANKLYEIATRGSSSSGGYAINQHVYNEFSNLPGMVVVLLDHNGSVIRSSLSPDTPFVSYNYLFDQVKNSAKPIFTNQSVSSTSMRFIAVPIKNETNLLGVILVAHPIGAIQKSVNSLLTTLFTVPAFLLVPTVAGSYLIARKIIHPISNISDKMAEISSENLEERVKNPGSGDEIEKLVTTFNSLLDRLQGSFQRERQFIGDVAHELKTPVATLRSGIELTLSKGRTKKEYKRSLDETIIDINRLSTTIKNILDLAWLGANNANQLDHHFDLSTVLREVKEIAVKLATRKHLTLKGEIMSGVVITGAQDKIIRAILNIVDNAIKFTPKGSVTLSLHKNKNEAIVTIMDTGIGIPGKELEHVFERFYRGSKTAKTLGSGLGLAITQGIIKAHHGKIEVASKTKKGTTVKISLPLHQKT